MIHFEIPWNPNRLEQRNGRIDRHGQKAKKVLIYHFVGKGYNDRERNMADTTVGDLEADLEFLMRAVRKVEAIREDLGKVGPVIAEQVEEAMLGRRTRLDTKQGRDRGRAGAEAVQVRAGSRQADQAADGQAATRRGGNCGSTPRTSRRSSRSPSNSPVSRRSIEAKVPGLWPDPKRTTCPVFHLPALTGNWEQCAEGLAHPFTGEARPFVFDHALAKGREDVVLVHLNHRLVQMSLRLLRAEVWSLEGQRSG